MKQHNGGPSPPSMADSIPDQIVAVPETGLNDKKMTML
jgi:hypothetical protein